MHGITGASMGSDQAGMGACVCTVQVIVTRVYATDDTAARRRVAMAAVPNQECGGFAPRLMDISMVARGATANALPLESALLSCRRSLPNWNGWQVRC